MSCYCDKLRSDLRERHIKCNRCIYNSLDTPIACKTCGLYKHSCKCDVTVRGQPKGLYQGPSISKNLKQHIQFNKIISIKKCLDRYAKIYPLWKHFCKWKNKRLFRILF